MEASKKRSMKRENRRGLVPIMGVTKLAKLRGRQIPFFFFMRRRIDTIDMVKIEEVQGKATPCLLQV